MEIIKQLTRHGQVYCEEPEVRKDSQGYYIEAEAIVSGDDH